jgi:hypothetical protein
MLYQTSGTSVPPSLDSRRKTPDFKSVKDKCPAVTYPSGGGSPPQKPPKYPLRIAKLVGTICQHCGEKFYPENKRGPVPQYCSRSCQCKAQRERWIQEALEAAA